MKTKIFILGLILFLILPLLAQEKVKEADLAKEEVLFTSILKDADFYPFYMQPAGATRPGWWTLKFENGYIIRVYKKNKSDTTEEIWQTGKKYVAIRNKKKKKLIEVKLLEE